MKYFPLCCFCFIVAAAFGQPAKKYPDHDFRFPLNITPSLAANFGALRTNHYHMGLDIRTQQRENLPVYAAADGYVSHIRIEPFGYGRAIFITHPNGYTTLYAHLNSFFAGLETFVHNAQYKAESWEQDIDFSPSQFPVRKGDFIALSGNTGGSEGPHVHFEIRDSGLENGHNRNPLLFGLPISDGVAPTVQRLGVFNRNQSLYENSPRLYSFLKKTIGGNPVYTLSQTVPVPAGKFCFGLSMQDKTNNSFSLGIYQTDLYLDGRLQNRFRMEECLYDDARYINAGIDYFTKYNGGAYLQLLSRLPGNKAPFYKGDGVLELTDDAVHEVKVEVSDVAGNKSVVQFSIRRDNNVAFPINQFSGTAVQTCLPNRASTFTAESIKVVFDQDAFYDTLALRYRSVPASSTAASPTHFISDYRIPVHSLYMASLKLSVPLSEALKKKVLMIRQSGNKKDAQTCVWENNWATAGWKAFGSLYLKVDTIPPTIRPVNVSSNAVFSKDQKLVFDAKDETSDLQSFNGYIDGHWVVFRQKDDRYTYDFDENCLRGEHELKVRAVDLAGNETLYQCRFSNLKN